LILGGVVMDQLKLVVFGDEDSSGMIDISDILYLRAQIIGTYWLDPGQFSAADIDKNGAVDINDILFMRAHILGTYTITAK
jgi:hypothetical protein